MQRYIGLILLPLLVGCPVETEAERGAIEGCEFGDKRGLELGELRGTECNDRMPDWWCESNDNEYGDAFGEACDECFWIAYQEGLALGWSDECENDLDWPRE